MTKIKLQVNKGFTLIELMVATTIFTLVMLAGMGALITSSNAAKHAQKLRTAVDNVNFAMESMTRELRTGTQYYCGNNYGVTLTGDCLMSAGTNVIVFTPQESTSRVAYKKASNGQLQRCENSDSNCSTIIDPITVTIDKLAFQVKGSSPTSDKIQPSVEIIMKGHMTVDGDTTPFALQSMSSQRSAE